MAKKFTIKSEFVRNVLTLTSGTAFAQLIPLLLAPFLSRIYNPEEFGRLALYLSIVQILGVVSSGRYELAIMLPKKQKEGVQVTLLSIIITFIFSTITLLAVLFFSNDIAIALGDSKLSEWLYLVPLSVLLMGLFNALNYFNTRKKKFKNIAKANIFKSFGGNLTQLLLGLAKFTSGGLIIGQVVSHLFGNIKMAKTFLKYKEEIRSTSRLDLKVLAKRYINFPKFSMWGIFLNTLAINVTNFFVSWFYSMVILGQYAHAYRYLTVPITLIGRSIGQVYFQRLSSQRGNAKSMEEIFIASLKKIILIAIIVFLPVYFFIESFFPIFFGEKWIVAGEYAKILTPLMGVRFVVSTLSISLTVMEKQDKELLMHVAIIIGTVLIWFFAYIYEMNIKNAIELYTIGLSAVYILILGYIYSSFKRSSLLST
ncbi:Membrane protein involved in the export of O-antigen and teichoic acid [Zobellia uliginosa]|uniref:Membrane protein involved in the export of O-antigen and teichoic acid n=1 Tax=Zobellia uliginosa TaxID=143224 RepID=A0ABY1KI88_9FLAO|nr:oligosaccharide flippase family protein [Zobellia uliginosa]SIS38227.1 Membrane protein involved in the export of O-antigen and teichoic acid [Zobellia uliginosa]